MPETDPKEREIVSADQEAIRAVIEELDFKRNTVPSPTVAFDQEQLLSSSTIKITEETLDSTSSAVNEVIVTVDSGVQVRELRLHKYVARTTNDTQAVEEFKGIS